MFFSEKNRKSGLYRAFSAVLVFTFIFTGIIPPSHGQIAPQTILNLPVPGTFVSSTDIFHPAMIKGVTVHPENPLEFDFIVDPGQDNLTGEEFETESTKMIKYFLAALTVPEEEMWVTH